MLRAHTAALSHHPMWILIINLMNGLNGTLHVIGAESGDRLLMP